jgi:uncharacterized repeat protein (TIGR01451 family)
VYKSFIARFSAVSQIATALLLTLTFSLPAQSKPRHQRVACVDRSPVSQRVILTLKADKKVVKPGDIVKYTVIAKNNSRCPLRNLMLKQPIPRGTSYLKNSATVLDGAELLFSVDGGKTFVAKPKIDNKEAPADAYNYIRWRFPDTIATNAIVTTTYKLQVK